MLSNLKWAIYARKSSESSERQIQSIPDQLKIFNDISAKVGLNVIEVITDEKSAKKPGVRVGFSRMIKRIEKGEINGILCWRLNRLARNPEEGGKIAQLLQNGIIKCIKTNEREYDPNYNMLLLAVELGMATEESRELAKGIQRGCVSKAEDGWSPTIAPIGYKNSKWGTRGKERILIDKLRFPLVRKMWDLMLTGNHSPSSIHRIAISEWNLTSMKRGKVGGTPFALSNLYCMFQNEFYTGVFKYRGKVYKGKHDPMVTVTEFERVQFLLGKKSQPKPIKHEFPFTGVMKCAECGSGITASDKVKHLKSTGEAKHYIYYHCSRRTKNRVCTAPPVTVSELEKQIKELLKNHTISEEYFQLGLKVLDSAKQTKVKERDAILAQQREHILSIERKQNKLITLLMNDTISESEYNNLKHEFEKQLALGKLKLEQVDEDMDSQIELMKNGFHFCRKASTFFELGDTETKRNILRHLGSNQKISNRKLCIITPKWFLAIKKGDEQYQDEKCRFELEKPLLDKGQNENLDFFTSVCATLENVRKELALIPDLKIPDATNWISPPKKHL